jgi:hypothetical protein
MDLHQLIESARLTINDWIKALEYYNESNFKVKPAPQEWSAGQLYMHLLEDTRFYLEQAENCFANNDFAEEEMTENAKQMFAENAFPPSRIKGNETAALNLAQPPDIIWVKERMIALKNDINAAINHLILHPSTGKTRHPGLGYFNAEEWLQFAVMHLRHHLRQKERIDAFLKTAE